MVNASSLPAATPVRDQMVVHGADPGRGFCRHPDRLSLGIRVRNTPEIDDAVGDGDVQQSGVTPGLFLQAGKDAIADRLVRRRDVEQLACAGHRLKKIGPAHHADQLAVLQDRQPLDGVVLQVATSWSGAWGEVVMTSRVMTSETLRL